jgi:phage shock protein C
MLMSRSLTLNKADGKLLGVCAGLADRFGWDATLVRVAFVLATLFGFGSAIIVYLIIGFVAGSGN